MRRRPDDRCADHEQRDELEAAHERVSQPVQFVLDTLPRHGSVFLRSTECSSADKCTGSQSFSHGSTAAHRQRVVGTSRFRRPPRTSSRDGQSLFTIATEFAAPVF
jgi:hypothetical protein